MKKFAVNDIYGIEIDNGVFLLLRDGDDVLRVKIGSALPKKMTLQERLKRRRLWQKRK